MLYTENLSVFSTPETHVERLRSLLCGEPSSMFCLLRAAPMECLTGVSTTCSVTSRVPFADGRLSCHQHLRFSWKDITLGDNYRSTLCETSSASSWDVDNLAQVVASVYTEMFKDEDFSSVFEVVRKGRQLLNHYNRASFVAFLRLVWKRYQNTHWSEVFDRFITLVSKHKPVSLQSQWAQELFLQLHLQRLHTSYILQEGMTSLPIYVPETWPATFRQHPLPSTISFLFRIPRERVQPILKEFDPMNATALDVSFQVTILTFSSPPASNSYSVIQPAFANRAKNVPSNWSDPHELIVYVNVPTWTLLMAPRKEIEISLRLNIDPFTIREFTPVLGLELIVFSTSIWNTEYVVPQINEQLPSVSLGARRLATSSDISRRGFHVSDPKLNIVNGRVEASTRINVTGNLQAKLAAGEKVDSSQKSPCTFCVNLGNSRIEIALPLPSQHSISRIRVARKSGWIEVITVFSQSTTESFSFTRFPVMKEATGNYYSWNMPRLLPSFLPRLKSSTTTDHSWINAKLSVSLSPRERSLHEKHLQHLTTGDQLVDFKENMFSLFTHAAGTRPLKPETAPNTFFLDIEGDGVMTIIFLASLRLDQNDGTVVADSFILPLVPELVAIFANELAALLDKGGVSLKCTRDAYQLWTSFLKASVERSRTWSHQRNCPGKFRDRPFDHNQQFLCRCGSGTGTHEFEAVREWKPFSSFVTRCLISPLFPVQCMESVVSRTADAQQRSTANLSEEVTAVDRACFTCKSKGGEKGKLLTCKGCRKATYCSKECQKKDWKQHKITCRS